MAAASARMTGSLSKSRGGSWSYLNSSDRAGESVVDAYATRTLQALSPPEACFDPSIGPYIASILRGSYSNDHELVCVENIPEYESLLELVEDNCSLTPDKALAALQDIADAVRTGFVKFGTSLHEDIGSNLSATINHEDVASAKKQGSGLFGSATYDVGALSADYTDARSIHMLGEMLSTTHMNSISSSTEGGSNNERLSPLESKTPDDDMPPFILDAESLLGSVTDEKPLAVELGEDGDVLRTQRQQETIDGNSCTQNPHGPPITPLKPKNLIPVDLLGELDDPSTPAGKQQATTNSLSTNQTESDIKGIELNASARETAGKEKGQRKTETESKELAAALFRPARTTQHMPAVGCDAKPPNQTGVTSVTSGSLIAENALESDSEMASFYQQQLHTVAQNLLCMNPDLGVEASQEAALMANSDFNVAQYVIGKAFSAPPVCRHLLNNGCYRSDCQFSHEVDGHTCLFWLRGRCSKGEGCRFLHGFSSTLLEGIEYEIVPDYYCLEEKVEGLPLQPTTNSSAIPIQPTTFAQENMLSSSCAPEQSTHQFVPSSFDNAAGLTGSESVESSQIISMALTSDDDPSLNHRLVRNSSSLSQTTAGMIYQPDPVVAASQSSQSFSFASVATKGLDTKSFRGPESGSNRNSTANSWDKTKFVKIPQDLWNPSINRNSDLFRIADPIVRYREVTAAHPRNDVIDLHFQSMKTFPVVLLAILDEKLRDQGEVWIVTGTGHSVGKKTHQKGGGALESGVLAWLEAEQYEFYRGKDKNGYTGAILVKQ